MAAFAAIPDVPAAQAAYIDFFPLSDQLLTAQTYFYFMFNHLVLIMLAYMLWQEGREYRRAFRVFLFIQIFYLAQYLIHYNSVWLNLGGWGISSHILTVGVLAY